MASPEKTRGSGGMPAEKPQRLSDDPLPRGLGGRIEPSPPFWGDFLLVGFKPKVQPGGGAMTGMGAGWE